ncbi:MAG: T9SS type A sorting domain-containing protein [Muribaculaceae bacterium]|jgi:ELWxxDGT repeat protein|nr:T9SS type A sorting domain-containing protein [Muribaculaceae bacterium]
MKAKNYLLFALLAATSISVNGVNQTVASITPDGVTVTSKEGASLNNDKRLVSNASKIFFTAKTDAAGDELWVSDGTAAGTKMVKDIVPGADGSNPQYLCLVGDKCFFAATTPDAGTELWVSDGTESGTTMVKDIYAGTGSSTPIFIEPFGSKVLFFAMDDESELVPVVDSTKPEKWLWVSDGTATGTVRIGDTPTRETGWDSNRGHFAVIGDKAVFPGFSADMNETLWVTDGTKEGTKAIKDINPKAFTGWAKTQPATIQWLCAVGNKAIFRAETVSEVTNDASLGVNGDIGSEIWVSDGTAAGTNWIGVDFAPGSDGGSPIQTQFAWTLPLNDHLVLFRADDGVHSVEPCVMDLNQPFVKGVNPKQVMDINPWGFPSSKQPSWPQEWEGPYNGMVYFNANGTYHLQPNMSQDLYSGYSMWRIDVSSMDVAKIDTAAYLATWSPTQLTIGTPNYSDHAKYYTQVGTQLYFVATDADNNTELWCMDSNDTDPYKVYDFTGNGAPYSLVNLNGNLYFVATVDGKLYEMQPNSGVQRVNVATSIKVYPNPVTDMVNVKATKSVKNISVMGLDGRVLASADAVNTINVASLQSGLYIVMVKLSDGEVVSQKIIKK